MAATLPKLATGAALLNKEVLFTGLISRKELNGTRGRVVSCDFAKGRVGVKCAEGGQPLSVKVENVREVAGEAAGEAGRDGVSEALQYMLKNVRVDAPARTATSVLNLNELLEGAEFEHLRAAIAQASVRPGCTPMVDHLRGDATAIVSAILSGIGDAQGSNVMREGCSALAKLSESRGPRALPNGKELVRVAGGAAALVAVLHETTVDVSVVRAGCHGLTNLSNGDLACKESVLTAGGAAAVTRVMRAHPQVRPARLDRLRSPWPDRSCRYASSPCLLPQDAKLLQPCNRHVTAM